MSTNFKENDRLGAAKLNESIAYTPSEYEDGPLSLANDSRNDLYQINYSRERDYYYLPIETVGSEWMWSPHGLYLKGDEYKIFELLYTFTNHGISNFRKSKSDIARMYGIDRRQIQRVFKSLEGKGLIKKTMQMDSASKEANVFEYVVDQAACDSALKNLTLWKMSYQQSPDDKAATICPGGCDNLTQQDKMSHQKSPGCDNLTQPSTCTNGVFNNGLENTQKEPSTCTNDSISHQSHIYSTCAHAHESLNYMNHKNNSNTSYNSSRSLKEPITYDLTLIDELNKLKSNKAHPEFNDLLLQEINFWEGRGLSYDDIYNCYKAYKDEMLANGFVVYAKRDSGQRAIDFPLNFLRDNDLVLTYLKAINPPLAEDIDAYHEQQQKKETDSSKLRNPLVASNSSKPHLKGEMFAKDGYRIKGYEKICTIFNVKHPGSIIGVIERDETNKDLSLEELLSEFIDSITD